jgi:hypothetical protein
MQPKRNKRGVHLLFARLRDGGVAQSGLSQTVRRAAIMHKLLAVAFLAASFAGPAGADTAEATQVLQQRTADGRLLLTDRPAAGAKTERSWQIEREDPAAARQRALDVKTEANLVTERVQRMLDQQRQQRADDDAQRMRLAGLQLERDRLAALNAQDGVSYGYAYGAAWPAVPFRASRHPGPRVGDVGIMDPTGTRRMVGRSAGHGNPTGSGSPENR